MFPRGGQCRTFCGKRATGAAGGGHSRTGSWEVSRSLRKTCHWASSHGPAASHCEGAHVGQSAFAHRPTARAPTGTLRSGGPPNASARRGGMARERARSATPASARAPTAPGARLGSLPLGSLPMRRLPPPCGAVRGLPPQACKGTHCETAHCERPPAWAGSHCALCHLGPAQWGRSRLRWERSQCAASLAVGGFRKSTAPRGLL